MFNYARGELTKAGARVTLTTRDIELLRHLTAAPGRIVSRLKLADGEDISERAIDVQINRLRRKIETVRATRFICKPYAARDMY